MQGNTIANMKVGSREHIEFSRLLVNTIQEYAIFLLDPRGYVATWNPGAQKLKGYTPKEIIGKHFSTFYPQKDIKARKPEIELEIAKRDGHVEDEGWRVRKDGTRFWANVVITALRDDNGDLVGFAKVTRDLTERRRHEQELRKANNVLKRQSDELLKLNKAKDEFISLASHQLRTPATGVKQYLGLILEGYTGELTDQQKDFIAKANESNNRQINLINDLLRVAQVDAGEVLLQPTTVDLSALIGNIADEHSSTFKMHNQLLNLHLPNGAVVIVADEARLRMAIENILDNASKYTPAGGSVTIAVHITESSVSVSITDTGVGIDEALSAKLFSKFSRIPNSLSEKVGGSGLGLYWAKKIIQLHGGDITVISQVNKGSTFTIEIPEVQDV